MASNAIKLIDASELHGVYEVLLDLKQQDAARELLRKYIVENRDRRSAFSLNEDFGQKYDTAFQALIEAEAVRFEDPVDLSKTLDAIDFNQGWNSEDLVTIAEAKFDEIALLLTGAEGHRLFARRLKTLLKFGDYGKTTKEKEVREHTIAWLEAFAATGPIAALRVRRFLPDDPPIENNAPGP